MKKALLALGVLAFGSAFSMEAKTQFYCPALDMFQGTTTIGGVSKNGEFAVVKDEDNSISYLWKITDPENWEAITSDAPSFKGFVATGVSNDGKKIAGTIMLSGSGNANTRPGVYDDGKWISLPTHEALVNTVEVMGCNSDASIIFGYQFLNDPTSEINGRYYPCKWTLNADGDYELYTYDKLPLPAHQGFVPWAMSEDGSIIAGTLFVPAGSTIPSFVIDGELVYFDELETRLEEFYYDGKLLGIYEEYYINGYHDGAVGEYFSGSFTGLDEWNNFYGYRTRAFDVVTDPEDKNYGSGKLVNGACVYNFDKREWHDFENVQAFSTGLDCKYIFTNGGTVMDIEGKSNTISNEFDFSPEGLVNPSITHTSADGKTLAGIHAVFNQAIGENDYFPFLLVLDEPLVESKIGIQVVKGEENVNIVISANRIDVAGVDSASLYDLNGCCHGNGTTFHVEPGIYVVKTNNGAHKVLVK